MRRRQRRGLAKALKKLYLRVSKGRLKKRDKILEAVGRFKERFPKAHPFVTIHVGATHREFTYAWNGAKFKDALRTCCAATRPAGPHRNFGKPTFNSRSSNAPFAF